MIKVLLWDVDGTILNFLAAEKEAMKKCFEVCNIGECTDEMIARYSKINKKYWEKLERGEITKPEVLVGRFEEFFESEGIITDCAAEFNKEYQVRLGDTICFCDNAYELLKSLKGSVKQYAVTNGTKVAQDKKLKLSGLDEIFDDIFISEELGIEKPGIGFFEKVWEKIGTYEANEVMIIGDSLTSDMQGGNNAGILCCWYNPNGAANNRGVKIDFEIDNLQEVRKIMTGKKINVLKNNPTMEGQVKLVQNVIYSKAGGEELPMTLLLPWNLDDVNIKSEKKPLIVFVQGSAWTTPDREFEIPQLSMFARAGYIVATIEHRSSLNQHAFPAFLQDVKCAIRFLRANSEKYGIDTERVAIWGTSSGGNAALLTGLTCDESEYKTEEYAEVSDKVCAVVECFGPTDLMAMSGMMEEDEPAVSDITYIMHGLCGGDVEKLPEVMRKMSPVNYVVKGKDVPPFLLIHGDSDTIVPYSQMTALFDKMTECEYDVEAWKIEGADHEGTFWSQQVYDIIGEFLKKHI